MPTQITFEKSNENNRSIFNLHDMHASGASVQCINICGKNGSRMKTEEKNKRLAFSTKMA